MVSLQEASTVIVVDIILAAGRLGAFFLLVEMTGETFALLWANWQ